MEFVGYEEQAELAKEHILKIVQDLDNFDKLDLPIDSRLHSRLIGKRGYNIRQVMEQFKVEIRFPVKGGDPDIVTIIGPHEKVQECVDHLLNLVEEYVRRIALPYPISVRYRRFTIGCSSRNATRNSTLMCFAIKM